MGIGSPNPLLLATAASGGDSDPVTRSLRFDDGSSPYLVRAASDIGSPTDVKKVTVSFWFKLGNIVASRRALVTATNGAGTDFWWIELDASHRLNLMVNNNSSSVQGQYITNRVFRDPSAWTHICVSCDSTASEAADRAIIYINGVRETSFSTANHLPADWLNEFNEGTYSQYISSYIGTSMFFDGLIADVYNIDGQQLEPTDFIEANDYGGYKPKEYTGSYGNNGFHLKLDDSSDIGADDAGSNDFTATNLSSHDVMLDTPTKNYATWNAAQKDGGSVFSEGNLKTSSVASNNYHPCRATFNLPDSTGWYAEFYVVSNDGVHSPIIGIQDASRNSSTLENIYVTKGVALRRDGVILRDNSSVQTGLGGTSNGDIIMVAYKDRKIWFGRNGSWFHSGDPANDSNESTTANSEISGYHFAINCFVNGQTVANFGQDPTFVNNKTSGQDTSQSEFYYAPPSGFKSLNSSNLDDPTVTPSEHFNTKLYSGSYAPSSSLGNTSQSITGVGFQPDMVWIKDRDNASGNYENYNSYYGNYLFDSLRGAGSAFNLDGDVLYGTYLNSSENGIDSFDTDGFTVDEAEETNFAYDSSGSGSIDGYERYVAWCWKLGQTGGDSTWASGNTDPASEKYNASAGVSLIRYTDDSYSSGTVTLNHSLGAAPEFAFVGDAYSSSSYFPAWHKDLSANNYLSIDSSSSQSSDSSYFPSGCSTANTFTVGSSISQGYSDLHIYLFSSVEGYSKFGKYIGNGSSSSGPFVYTGFRPRFLMIKRVNSSDGGWKIMDTARDPHNVVTKNLYAHQSDDEDDLTSHSIDLLSNGFKWRTSGNHENANGHDYIYAAFAESPFKHANAR